MATTSDLISNLQQRGVKLWISDGQLRLKTPRGVVSPLEMSLLRAHREEITRLVAQSPPPVEDPIRPRESGQPVPLTAMQARTWRRWHSPERPNFRRVVALTNIGGQLDIELLRKCLEALTHRHESLRTHFLDTDGVLRQQIDAPRRFDLDVVDMSRVAAPIADQECVRHAGELVARRRDLSVGPLFEAKLLKISERSHTLILILDHMIMDGASNEILWKELWVLYEQGARDPGFSLPDLPLQFADYAVWQEQGRDAWMLDHADYWRNHLKDLPPIRVPPGDGLTESHEPKGTFFEMPMGEALSARLREMAREKRTLLPLVVFAAHLAMMSRLCNQSDWVGVFVTGGRWRPELQSVVGWFANHLYLRVRIAADDTLLGLLEKVVEEFRSAQAHQDFDRVPDLVPLAPECTADLSFNWMSRHEDVPAPAQLRLRSIPHTLGRPIRFRPYFVDTGTEIRFAAEYRPDVFKRETIERIGRDVQHIAAELAENPECRISALIIDSGVRPVAKD